jgi:hypothetical protein
MGTVEMGTGPIFLVAPFSRKGGLDESSPYKEMMPLRDEAEGCLLYLFADFLFRL